MTVITPKYAAMLCGVCLCGLFFACAIAGEAAAEDVIPLDTRRELFLDEALIEEISGGARRQLHHPVPGEVVMKFDAPWEGTGCGYVSLFKDGDIFRMYYKAWDLKILKNGKVGAGENYYACYAESRDGIHWEKPNLGLYEVRGDSKNNVIMTAITVGQFVVDPAHPAVFKDANPDCPPEALYKAFFVATAKARSAGVGLLAFGSSDGIHWSPLSDSPVITEGAFDSQNLAFWDSERKVYRAYWRYFDAAGVRGIKTATSTDFLNWSKPTALEYPGSVAEQLYVNQIQPYYRAPHLLVGFPVRYSDRGNTHSLSSLPDYEHRKQRMDTQGRYGTAITECLLMSSRDGVTFDRWAEAFMRPGIQRPGTWNYGQQYVGWQLIETPSSLPGAPPELSLYATEDYWLGKQGSKLRRYTLRLDGFVSINAPMSGGEVVTKLVTFTGSSLSLNFSSSAAGDIRVQLEDEKGVPLPGFSLEECEPIYGDEHDRTVAWKPDSNVGSLAGKPIRIRFQLRDADLYSYQFKK